MEGIGHLHSEESRFSTWNVVGEALSNALLSEPDGLYVQSTTKIHRKVFLLYTKKKKKKGRSRRRNKRNPRGRLYTKARGYEVAGLLAEGPSSICPCRKNV